MSLPGAFLPAHEREERESSITTRGPSRAGMLVYRDTRLIRNGFKKGGQGPLESRVLSCCLENPTPRPPPRNGDGENSWFCSPSPPRGGGWGVGFLCSPSPPRGGG